MNERELTLAIIFLIGILILGCVQQAPIDPNAEVPSGDPAFPSQKEYGIHDPNNILSGQTITGANEILKRLNDDGIAQVAVLIQYNVHHPEDYATHYGRYIGLGQIGKDNGLVYLIRPDVDPNVGRITVSIGRGLPKFTAIDAHQIIKEAAMDYINIDDYNNGVLSLVKDTDKRLREIYAGEKNGG
jgi:uncharacterized membrane protein YgcG